ncbi:tripartite tricarboxylate transporter substrate binding protein [Pseudochelatococcus sp. B33]
MVSLKKLAAVLALAIAVPLAAEAAEYPDDRVKFVVPFAPGGGSDAVALRIVRTAAKYTDKPIDLLYMPGGGGVIGARHVVQAEPVPPLPILVALSEFITAPPAEAGYVAEDFEWIAGLTVYGIGVVVPPNSQETLASLIERAKNQPGSVSLGSLVGGGSEIINQRFEELLGAKFKFVPFTSNGETMLAVLGGHVDLALVSSGGAMDAHRNKTARVISMSLPERLSALPDVPTISEVTGHDFNFGIDRAIFAQKGISPEARAWIEDLIEKVVNDPVFSSEVAADGENPAYRKGEEFRTYLNGQLEMLRPLFAKTDKN